MKKIQRLQFILSPVLIAILSVLLVVVSFSWYQVQSNLDIEVEDVSVSITVNEPEGTSVDLTPLGDAYDYNSTNQTYSLTSPGTIVGYFGQTGLGSLNKNDVDKPYIVFYEAEIISDDDDNGIVINDCYVKGLVITKDSEEMENEEYLTENESEFMIEFYTKDPSSNVFSNPQSSFALEPGTLEATIYVGIKFFKEGSSEDFKFSNIKYYQSNYSLQISFYNNRI